VRVCVTRLVSLSCLALEHHGHIVNGNLLDYHQKLSKLPDYY
jgi:hypothetical protein